MKLGLVRALKRLMVGLGLGLLVIGCQDQGRLAPFSSDGCSLFPDGSELSEQDWCDCCFEHDLAYWQGGTEQQRLAADRKLRECVLKKTGDEQLAELMFQGVRFGGSPYFYNWYRWGYGWSFERGYRALSENELAMVERELKKYYNSNPEPVCAAD